MRRAPRPALLLVLLAATGLSRHSSACADEMSPERQREILREALSTFDDAVARAVDDPTQARERYRHAAASFEALVAAGLSNPALHYNLGNTYFRLGELGRAVLHYRRAERIDPTSAKLQANLAYVRRQVEPLFEPRGPDRLMHRLLAWHYRTSLRQRFWSAALLSSAGWLLLAARLRWPTRRLLAAGVVAVVCGLASAASAIWQVREEALRPPAVLVGQEQVLRLGRGDSYDPALPRPLGPGVELRILQQRGDWVEVQLPNDQTGWLLERAVERV